VAEPVNLEFPAAQLRLVLDEQRSMRSDLRRLTDNQAGMLRLIDKLSDRFDEQRDELLLSIKIEIGGLFANLETRLEHRIAAEIEARLTDPMH